MKIRYWVLLGFLAFLTIVTWSIYDFSSGLHTDTYHGRVVDEDTGAPLAGAVITVVWYRTPAIQIERSLLFQSAQETMTNSDGSFSLEVSPGLDWDWSTTRIAEPDIIIFAPGYEPTSPVWIQRWNLGGIELAEALKQGVVIKLRKLKTKEEMESAARFGLVRVPSGAIPKLFAALNEQRRLAGFGPLLP